MTDTNILNHEYNLPPSPIAEAVEAESSIWEDGQLQPSAPLPSPSLSPGATPTCDPPRGPTRSNPDSRRASQHSMAGASVYGGLPPSEPLPNPRRSSVTGSYGLPCPPDWLRSQAAVAGATEDFRLRLRNNNSLNIRDDSPTTMLGFIREQRQKSLTPKGTKSFGGGTVVRCSRIKWDIVYNV